MMPLRLVSKKIGELLIERRVITPEQLAIALKEQKEKGGYVSQRLIDMGFASELDIATCLSNQYNFAYLPIQHYNIPIEMLALIPLKFIRIYTLLPIDKIGIMLSVTMADPLNEGVIQALQQITNSEIMVFISTYSELNTEINKYFGEKLKDLEKYSIAPEDLEKIKTARQLIHTEAYRGPERREYVRVKKELDITFYYHDITFQAKTINISYGGISCVSEHRDEEKQPLFSNVFIPLNTSLASRIYLKTGQPPIDVVVKALKVWTLKEGLGGLSGKRYEIAGMFEFIASEDRAALVSFLKENIS